MVGSEPTTKRRDNRVEYAVANEFGGR
eukprot:SAG31_NODE_41577_length_275_cov_0.880682_1_plen_26_part_10